MDSKHVGFALALGCAVLTSAYRASADLPPPADYVETCTVEKQQTDAKACVACPSYYATVDKCKSEYSDQGYTQACKSWGASVWTEVWCKPSTDGTAGAPNQDVPIMPQGGSDGAGGASTGAGGALVTAGGAVAAGGASQLGTGGAKPVGGAASSGGSSATQPSASNGDDNGCAIALPSRGRGVAALVALSLTLMMAMRRRRFGR